MPYTIVDSDGFSRGISERSMCDVPGYSVVQVTLARAKRLERKYPHKLYRYDLGLRDLRARLGLGGLPPVADVVKALKDVVRGLDPCTETGEGETCAYGCHEPDTCRGTVDVRLNVRGRTWRVLWGPSDYDQDHRGAWGSSTLTAGKDDEDEDDLDGIARDLIDQVADMLPPTESYQLARMHGWEG